MSLTRGGSQQCNELREEKISKPHKGKVIQMEKEPEGGKIEKTAGKRDEKAKDRATKRKRCPAKMFRHKGRGERGSWIL